MDEPPANPTEIPFGNNTVAGGVFEMDPTDFVVIKQEPNDNDDEVEQQQEMIIEQHEDEVMGASFIADDNCDDEHQVYTEEIDDVILQRAVSPPTYADHCDPEELLLFYKEKFQLKDLTVQLQNCDAIWETMRIIKLNAAYDKSSFQADSPKNSYTSPSASPVPTIPYEPTMGNSNTALPDFRFSVKCKKMLYHCVSCGKEYADSNQLRQHGHDAHGVFVNPKRMYTPRADTIAKSIRDGTNVNKGGSVSGVNPPDSMAGGLNNTNSVASGSKTPNSMAGGLINPKSMDSGLKNPNNMVKIPLSQTTDLPPVEMCQTVESTEMLNSENSENSTLSVNAIIPEPPARVSNHKLPEIKEKVKCVLCKRVCSDIINHMKGYHKVGCVRSIIDQCEKVVDNPPESDKISVPVLVPEPVIPSQEIPAEVDLNVPLPTNPRKRRRNNHPRWTVPKKKFKQNTGRSVRMPIEAMKVGFKKYKCDVCFGIYKSAKSFSYHRKLHRIRGETPENFDPSKCRFKNSPLRVSQTNKLSKEALSKYVKSQREPVQVKPAITSYLTRQQLEHTKPVLKTEEPSVQHVNNQTPVERTACECGRTFRNYHTLFLHKVKCSNPDGKGNHANDSDSGLGISIKIKKNKNDSYEVVSRTTPTDEYRSCKDSDASSNDSGVVSVDSTSQKAESSKYQTHSACRIRVEENDIEVDIEDDNSNQSNFNGNDDVALNGNVEDSADAASSVSENDSLQNGSRPAKTSSKKSSNIPSLKTLCRQALSKSKDKGVEEVTPHRCVTCRSYFKTMVDLMEHASNLKHDVKSICSCGKDFKSLKYYNIHVRRMHPLLLNCSYCMTNFDRIEKYLCHKCDVAEGKLFIDPIIQTQCMKCETLVDLGDPFDKHMKTHGVGDVGNLYQCYKCDITFDNPHQRRSHFSKEHGFSPCRICGKVLHIDHLSRHDAYHDGLGYPCHLCKKTFSQKTLLKKHVQSTHDPLVNEVARCIVCLKNVKLRHLKKHMSFHLHKEICQKCNKCYRYDGSNTLEDHMTNNHANDFPILKCGNCKATFVFDKEYEEHCQQCPRKDSANDIETTVQTI